MRGNTDFNKNNLDCLRLILASTVVLVHHYALTNFHSLSIFNHEFAMVAVKGFFVISGLLIYRSYTKSSSFSSYLEKRVRRIYPAYFTIVVLAAIALCSLSTLPLSQYFGAGFWKYLGANLLFLNFLAPTLPGVFASNIMPAVNGALWTLKIEVAFYLLVPLIHSLSSRMGATKVVTATFLLSCAWKFGFAWLDTMYHSRALYTLDSSRSLYAQMEAQFPGQLMYFCAGILLLLYFDRLILHFGSIAGISVGLFLVDHFFTGDAFDVLWIAGLVFVFGFWRYFGNFSKYGDFSYGVYIVHFPILQTLIALGLAKLNPAIFMTVSLSLIFLASLLMWHLVEKRFLKSGSHYRREATKVPG